MHFLNIVDGRCLQKNFLKKFLLNKVYFPNFANRYILNPVLTILLWLQFLTYRDLKFGLCIKNPINKTCRKNAKDLSNGAPKIKLWNHTKKTHFPVFAKNFRRPHIKLKFFFFANFQILGPLGCQGWVVIPQNVKKVKITAPYSAASLFPNKIIMFCLPIPTVIYMWEILYFQDRCLSIFLQPVCGLILQIYKLLTDTWCENLDWGRAIPRKGIHKWDFSLLWRVGAVLWARYI